MLKITASLLNSWGYLWECSENYQDDAYQSLVNYLHGIRTPPTEAMQKGIDFEKLAIDGQVPIISDIIKDGQYQLYAEKVIVVDDVEYKLLGFIDVLKAGVIYDIKRTSRYEYPKYINSYQHWIYFLLVPDAYEFRYLIGAGYSKAPYDETVNIITNEVYYNSSKAKDIIVEAIRQFIAWLKTQGLYEVYVKNYTIKN